jgi:hypothetical protein
LEHPTSSPRLNYHETSLAVNGNHRAVIELPEDILPGKHHAIITIDSEQVQKKSEDWVKNFPVDSLGGWPEGFTMSRDQLYGDDGR